MTLSQSRETRTASLTRGICRLLVAEGQAVLTEVTLPNGKRADVMALAADGTLSIVEIKSGWADFAVDAKWPDYLGFADRFAFAVDRDFPADKLPTDVGLIIADGFEAVVSRPLTGERLAPARRRALTLRFARLAADRLLTIQDPEARPGWAAG